MCVLDNKILNKIIKAFPALILFPVLTLLSLAFVIIKVLECFPSSKNKANYYIETNKNFTKTKINLILKII